MKRVVAILRLAVPYTGIILSTREKGELRDELLYLGVSQISAGSKTSPGGYSSEGYGEQFSLFDNRSLKDVVKEICKRGYIPSFCTACYRSGRTGKDFMDLAKPGLIKKFCLANCLLTFKEYLEEFGDDELKKVGDEVINSQIAEVDNSVREKVVEKMKKGGKDEYV